MSDARSRKWLLTINNPIEKGYTHEVIKSILKQFSGLVYWCMSDETGKETQTFHTHVYFQVQNAAKMSTVAKRFEGAHWDLAKGTAVQNRDYVFKEGKWLDKEKGETNHRDSHEEEGELPAERQGERNDISDLYDMIKQGMTDYEILEASPQYMLQMDKIERVRQVVMEEIFKKEWRDLHVTYIYGETGSGKTRSVMEKYGYDKVFRVTDYEHPFDGYKGQGVIVFEEFRSNIRIGDMLNYLDGYPVELRCRYANKVACYTEVFIISNIALRDQYHDLQIDQRETWKAFLRRIHEVRIHLDGKVHIGTCKEYMQGFIPVRASDIPFDKEKQDKSDKKGI